MLDVVWHNMYEPEWYSVVWFGILLLFRLDLIIYGMDCHGRLYCWVRENVSHGSVCMIWYGTCKCGKTKMDWRARPFVVW